MWFDEFIMTFSANHTVQASGPLFNYPKQTSAKGLALILHYAGSIKDQAVSGHWATVEGVNTSNPRDQNLKRLIL